MNRLLAFTWKKLPHLVSCERKDGCQEPSQAVRHQIHRRLSRSAFGRLRRKCVETVFGNVEVEGAQVDGQESINRLKNRRVVVLVIRPQDALCDLSVAGEDISVPLLETHRIYEGVFRLEVVTFPQKVSPAV